MKNGRVIAIGDIHGCSRALEVVVRAVDPRPSDTLVLLGDLVDRGPDTRGVLEQVLDLSKKCQVVGIMGNHEEMLLDVLVHKRPPDHWIRFGASDTLDSYGFCGDLRVIPASHLDFLSSCRDYFETDSHFFVHANYDARLPLEDQSGRVLRWIPLQTSLPAQHVSGKTAIVGHTASRSGDIFDVGHLVCIDTYCYGGGWLTAMDVGTRQKWQADLEGRLRAQPGGGIT